jgi:penicillin-binding protein 1A
MVDMMKDVIRRGTAAGSVWSAGFHYPAGGKTGTTNDGTNVWFIGYTSDLVAGVWMGFDKPKKIMSDAQGGRLAAPAWTTFMTEVYRRRPAPADWPRPPSIITREIDFTTGLLQTPYCPRDVVGSEVYIPGTEPTRECDKHTGYAAPGYDTLGVGAPPPAYTPPPVSGGTRVIPGASPTPRRDTLRARDSIPPTTIR